MSCPKNNVIISIACPSHYLVDNNCLQWWTRNDKALGGPTQPSYINIYERDKPRMRMPAVHMKGRIYVHQPKWMGPWRAEYAVITNNIEWAMKGGIYCHQWQWMGLSMSEYTTTGQIGWAQSMPKYTIGIPVALQHKQSLIQLPDIREPVMSVQSAPNYNMYSIYEFKLWLNIMWASHHWHLHLSKSNIYIHHPEWIGVMVRSI